ncbi:MAG TPA: hypothetical protein ENN90_15625 [Mariniphaga anaerophila]|uniref:Collagen-binding domain of a collagenase n=1 Tax=Mariniphaga anaerophila TaxID=1484053 RepID=A0A831LPE2_9BACT|nr:hypothetical protein [Mariniphaga anaerophila]
MKNYPVLLLASLFLSFLSVSCEHAKTDKSSEPIRIYGENPFYWEYKGEPVLLVGGSKEDNLFNHPDGLENHLDILKENGGNYIRNTMSSRNPGNPWAFKKLDNGLYDLEQWDEEFWRRFKNLLDLCKERDIIVQIEIWDPWDYFKTEAPLGYGPDNVGWESCPYNPALNINYTTEESQLATEIDYYSTNKPTEHVFFHTVPVLKDIAVVRKYQEKFVEKILSISLDYPNVLYCMNNEIGEPAEWGEYWAQFIRKTANEAGKEIFLADMRRNSNFESEEQVKLLNDRENYDFFEISQNNANNDQRHYDLALSIREKVADNPKPLNNVKIYGGNIGSWTTSVEEGTRRFWRSVFAGCASVRFHREGPSQHFFGIGLSELAQVHIQSMRMFSDEFQVFKAEPANQLLTDRESNEAYCLANPGKQYAVYFTGGGEISLDLSDAPGSWDLKWLNIRANRWLDGAPVNGGGFLPLKTPGSGQWVVLLKPN